MAPKGQRNGRKSRVEEDGVRLTQTAPLLLKLARQFGHFGGRLEEIGQDSLDAAFGIEPLEDTPRRAANAALAVAKGAESGQDAAAFLRALRPGG